MRRSIYSPRVPILQPGACYVGVFLVDDKLHFRAWKGLLEYLYCADPGQTSPYHEDAYLPALPQGIWGVLEFCIGCYKLLHEYLSIM